MKKLIITLILLMFIPIVSIGETTILKTIKVSNAKLTVLCIDGYKFIIIKDQEGSLFSSSTIIQVFKKSLFGTSLPDTCP
jgi:hypothetical protein